MAEMKIRELNIGDWVQYQFPEIGKNSIQVNSIDEEDNHIGAGGVGASVWSDVSSFKPIPLTPEILEKNGFVKWQGGLVLIGDEISCRYEDGNLTIEQGYRDNDGVLVERLLVNIECKAVHQLQHVFRLAGVEKDIKLK